MEVEEYITKRVKDQINWYSKKSKSNQNCFKFFRILSVSLAVSIPFLTGLIEPSNESCLKIIIGLLGALIAIIEGIMALYKFHENWIQYRTTAESLKHHKYMFLTNTGPYRVSEIEAFDHFVMTVEGLISKENSDWRNQRTDKEKPD